MNSSKLRWHQRDTAPGIVLLAATALSFALLNSSGGAAFGHLLEDQIGGLVVGAHKLSLHLIVNDGMMAVFFLYVGLELKRETVEGPFKNPREAALPLAGALGGMAAPALIYLAFTAQAPELQRGWAIPAATDIAFAIGVLSLLGARTPPGLRLFLLALAIIDDLGAILVIALVYSTHLAGWALGGALAAFLAMLLLNRAGVRALTPYWLLGLVCWGFMLVSGVHATIGGVLTALAVPMRANDGRSPLIAAEHALKPWVAFAIMPLFALANAGVELSGDIAATLAHPITQGAALGLVIGKPLGIMSVTALAAGLLRQSLPASPTQMLGASMLAGIGFTMSLFIGALAFEASELAAAVRIGVLGGSVMSALFGLGMLSLVCRKAQLTSSALGDEEDIAEARGVLEDIHPRDEK